MRNTQERRLETPGARTSGVVGCIGPSMGYHVGTILSEWFRRTDTCGSWESTPTGISTREGCQPTSMPYTGCRIQDLSLDVQTVVLMTILIDEIVLTTSSSPQDPMQELRHLQRLCCRIVRSCGGIGHKFNSPSCPANV